MSTLLTEPAVPAAAAPADSATSTVKTETPTAAPASGVPPESPRWAVPENMRTDETLKKFMDEKFTVDPGVLAQSYTNLQSQLGRDKITIPKSDEEFAKAYDALGRPANAEAYEVKKPELPEGMQYDEAGEKLLRTFAHENGWNQKQFANAYDMYFKTRMEEVGAWTKTLGDARTKAEDSLKREWGDAYQGKSELARSVFQQYGDAELSQYLDTSGLGNDPRIIKIFAKIGEEMMGDSKLKHPGGGNGGITPAEIDAKIAEFRKTNEKALFQADHPDHRRLVADLQKLYDLRPQQAKV